MAAKESQGPRILIYDIETSPTLAWVWSAYETDIIAIKDDWQILCFAYQWLGGPIKFLKREGRSDKSLVMKLHELFNEADIVVAHNGDKFDQRKANARFSIHGLSPPSYYQAVDTLKVSRKYFGHLKHNLNELGRLYGIGQKMPHEGFQLWLDCMANKDIAWRKMRAYNIRDVALLNTVYYRIKPWMDNHPNMTHWKGECTKCGSANTRREGYRLTRTGKNQIFQCKDCGGYSTLRKAEKSAIVVK